MIADRPSAYNLLPPEDKERLSGLVYFTDNLRKGIKKAMTSFEDLDKRVQPTTFNYFPPTLKQEFNAWLPRANKLLDSLEEFVDIVSEYLISAYGGGLELGDDHQHHPAYSITSRQLAIKMLSKYRELNTLYKDSYLPSNFAHSNLEPVRQLAYQRSLSSLPSIDSILHGLAYEALYKKDDAHYNPHCIQQIASTTSFSKWVNHQNRSARGTTGAQLVRFVNFTSDKESLEQSKIAFTNWVSDQQTTAREIANLDIDCRKFLVNMLGERTSNLNMDKLLALLGEDQSVWRSAHQFSTLHADKTGEMALHLDSAISKSILSSLQQGIALDEGAKKYLESLTQRDLENRNSTEYRFRVMEFIKKYNSLGTLAAMAHLAKQDLADLFISKDALPWEYADEHAKNPLKTCFPQELQLKWKEMYLSDKIDVILDDIAMGSQSDHMGQMLEQALYDNYRNQTYPVLHAVFSLLTNKSFRAKFKGYLACQMIKNEALTKIRQWQNSAKGKYDFYRLIATMISFFNPLGKEAGQTAAGYIHYTIGDSLQGTRLGELIKNTAQGSAKWDLRGDHIRVSEGNIVYRLPTQNEEDEQEQ